MEQRLHECPHAETKRKSYTENHQASVTNTIASYSFCNQSFRLSAIVGHDIVGSVVPGKFKCLQ